MQIFSPSLWLAFSFSEECLNQKQNFFLFFFFRFYSWCHIKGKLSQFKVTWAFSFYKFYNFLSCALNYFCIWEEVRNTYFCICISICSTLLVKKIIPSPLNCLYIFLKKLVVHIHVGLLGLFLDFCPIDLSFVNTRLSWFLL